MKITPDKIKPGMKVVNPNGRAYIVTKVEKGPSGYNIFSAEGCENTSGKLVKFTLLEAP